MIARDGGKGNEESDPFYGGMRLIALTGSFDCRGTLRRQFDPVEFCAFLNK
jgi:hypothetical protein